MDGGASHGRSARWSMRGERLTGSSSSVSIRPRSPTLGPLRSRRCPAGIRVVPPRSRSGARTSISPPIGRSASGWVPGAGSRHRSSRIQSWAPGTRSNGRCASPPCQALVRKAYWIAFGRSRRHSMPGRWTSSSSSHPSGRRSRATSCWRPGRCGRRSNGSPSCRMASMRPASSPSTGSTMQANSPSRTFVRSSPSRQTHGPSASSRCRKTIRRVGSSISSGSCHTTTPSTMRFAWRPRPARSHC